VVVDGPCNDGAVEYVVLNHLKHEIQGTSTIHYVENGLVNSLFGLLCWKAIFAPIPGAFFHDFQHGPADLSSGCFYERRQQDFADCFAELESDQYKTTIRRCFSAKAGMQSPFVVWRLLSKQLLESALTCIPAAHLRIWFEWIVRDVEENRAGFPDLVQFWPLERRYRMIEVKGPGDRLQDNQRRLLEYCVSHQMPVSVCHLRWTRAWSRST
jgi:VRR-NUC domain